MELWLLAGVGEGALRPVMAAAPDLELKHAEVVGVVRVIVGARRWRAWRYFWKRLSKHGQKPWKKKLEFRVLHFFVGKGFLL